MRWSSLVISTAMIASACDYPRLHGDLDAAAADATVDASESDAAVDATDGGDAAVMDGSSDAPVDAPPIDAAIDGPPSDAAIDGPPSDAWDPIPPDVPPVLRQGFVSMALPPTGWTSGAPWMQALHDGRLGGSSTVEIDWIRLYAVVGTSETLLVGDGPGLLAGVDWGNTYLRIPWYAAGSEILLTVHPNPEIVTFAPASDSARVWGWGGLRASAIPAGTTHCRMRALVRITGNALVQAGIDYWRTPAATGPGDNVRAGHSDWYFATPNWQTIVVDLEI